MHHWTDRLSEYRDGELSADERTRCEEHLAACASCRETLDDIEAAVRFARADGDQLPAADLWPGILARLEPRTGASAPVATVESIGAWKASRPQPRTVSFTLPQLALAATLLIAVSAAVAYIAAGRNSAAMPGAAGEASVQAVAEPMLPPSPDVTPANFADAQFDRAVADLEEIVSKERDTLDPRTVAVIERNLAAIDEAIRQARAALDADPANPFLNSHLVDARRRKLDLLRQAATISSIGGD